MIIVFDIDGTIRSGEHRAHLIPADHSVTENWTQYNQAGIYDTPRPAMLTLLDDLSRFNTVHLVTGAGDNAYPQISEWLRRYTRYSHCSLTCRPMEDHRPGWEYKLQVFQRLKPDLIIDDDPLVIKACREAGFTVLAVDSRDPAVYTRSE